MKEMGNNFKLSLLKEVRIRSLSGPYSVQMPENADQKDSDTSYEYRHFLRSVCICGQLFANSYLLSALLI